MHTRKPIKETVIARALWLAFGTFCYSAALSAQTLSNTNQENDKTIQKVEVTGSSIKRIDAETASPVQIIKREQIEQMGANTLVQVLDNLTSALPDLKDSRSFFTGTDGASSANLRGLGAHATLVLLNGRRLSNFGQTMNFQTQFVNIDSIPVEAIERVEVLADGASAIYGSDAIAGVINIITKKNYQGLGLNASIAKSLEIGARQEHNAAISYGKGNLEQDKYNVFGSLSVHQRNPVYLPDILEHIPSAYFDYHPNYLTNFRIKDGSQPGQVNPGTLFAFSKTGTLRAPAKGCISPVSLAANGSNTTCALNTLNLGSNLAPGSSRVNAFVAGTFDLGDKLEAFAEVSLSHIETRTRVLPPSFSSGDLPSWYARNTGINLNTMTRPYLSPDNPYNTLPKELWGNMGGVAGLSRRFIEADFLAEQRSEDDEGRIVAGLRGIWGKWDWESALTMAGTRSVLNQRGSNPSVSGYLAAFGPYRIDPTTGYTLMNDKPAYQFGVDTPANRALLEKMYPNVRYPGWDRIINWDGKLSGKIASLPGGDVMLATGINLNYENFYSPGDPAAAAGDIWWQGGTWFKGSRTVKSVYGEVLLPFTKNLEMDLALRDDKYPGFANHLAPKVGIKLQALDQLLLRGTYSTGFRAPSLAESGTGGMYAVRYVTDPVRCEQTNAIANVLLKSKNEADVKTGKTLLNTECGPYTIGGVTQPNPDLQPETAKIATLGMVVQASRHFDFSFDYYYVNRRNEIVAEPWDQILTKLMTQYGREVSNVPGRLIRVAITPQDLANQGQAAAVCAANPGLCSKLPSYSVGQVGGMVGSYKNHSQTLIDGFDVSANGRFNLADYGKLSLNLQSTIQRRNITQEPGGDWNGNAVGTYGNPRITARLSGVWSYQAFDLALSGKYTGPQALYYAAPYYGEYGPEDCPSRSDLPSSLCSKGLGGFTNWTMNLAWKPKANLKLDLNVQNLLNHKPEYDPQGWNGTNVFDSYYGRVVSLTLNYQFK